MCASVREIAQATALWEGLHRRDTTHTRLAIGESVPRICCTRPRCLLFTLTGRWLLQMQSCQVAADCRVATANVTGASVGGQQCVVFPVRESATNRTRHKKSNNKQAQTRVYNCMSVCVCGFVHVCNALTAAKTVRAFIQSLPGHTWIMWGCSAIVLRACLASPCFDLIVWQRLPKTNKQRQWVNLAKRHTDRVWAGYQLALCR